MKYIIMAAGKGTRWNNYLGITKQEAVINNESLIERTVRLIRENCIAPNIIISSPNINHCVNNTNLFLSSYSGLKGKYTYELLDDDITYLYGDTFYEDVVISKIINDNIDDIMFYGNSKALVGMKVYDYEGLRKTLDSYDGDKLYHAYKGKFRSIGNEIFNINYPYNYENLKFIKELMHKENKMLSLAISHKPFFSNGIVLEEKLNSDNVHRLLDIKETGSEKFIMTIFTIDNPHFIYNEPNNKNACIEVMNLKNNKDIVYVTETPIEFVNSYEYLYRNEHNNDYHKEKSLRRILK